VSRVPDCGEHCVWWRESPDRRAFIARSVLASVAALLSQACGDGQIGGLAPEGEAPPPVGGTLVVTLADFPALGAVGGIARVDEGTASPIAVARLGTSSYAAFSMICPHAGYRPIGIVTGGFKCPNHGAEFAADGSWTGGQRTRDLRSYTVAHDAGAGTLTIS
jgi:Rieske Fe-S protein